LTDPAAIAGWAPVNFEVDGLAGGRLAAGRRERVSGSIAGIGATFDVEVMRADTKGLELVADGPISLDVNYSFTEHDDGVSVHARVGIRRRRGLTAQLLQAAGKTSEALTLAQRAQTLGKASKNFFAADDVAKALVSWKK